MVAEGEKLDEGKTKIIWSIPGEPGQVLVESKDDLTAGDGKKHDVLESKGTLATETTCNVFRLLRACRVPVAFLEQTGATTFTAQRCQMLKLEVVARRSAYGSFLKRNPHVSKGHIFPRLVFELFLKTSGRSWGTMSLPCDDPLLVADSAKVPATANLFVPSMPLAGQQSFASIVLSEVVDVAFLPKIEETTRQVFLVLEKAWQLLDRELIDMKIEFGITPDGRLVVSDVIDNDSWRVLYKGQHEDKQVYREDGSLAEVLVKYQRITELTRRFGLPQQQLVIWMGSDKDALDPFSEAFESLVRYQSSCRIAPVVRSGHKEPTASCIQLHALLQEVPDSVVIAHVGRSNGLGSLLAANCTAPVIAVPAGLDKFPDDIWSSLCMPSSVPLMTVLSPANAVLAALQILSARNPCIYAMLRQLVEDRLQNLLVL